MRHLQLLLLAMFLGMNGLSAQVNTSKPVVSRSHSTKLSIGVGYTQSVLFLSRNVKENNDARGLTGYAIYRINRLYRVSLEYTYYRPINIEPTWYDIKASTIESNLQIVTRFKESKAIFYPMFGLSYNRFKGFFTGKNDFMGLYEKYPLNATVSSNWLGVNIGTGYETYIKSFSLFAEYKMRVGFNNGKEVQLNIMDVCIGGGIRYTMRVRSIYSILKGTRNRYFLDKED